MIVWQSTILKEIWPLEIDLISPYGVQHPANTVWDIKCDTRAIYAHFQKKDKEFF